MPVAGHTDHLVGLIDPIDYAVRMEDEFADQPVLEFWHDADG